MTHLLQPSLATIRSRLGENAKALVMQAPVPLYELPAARDPGEIDSYPFQLAAGVEELLDRQRTLESTVNRVRPGRAGQIVCLESLVHPDLGSSQRHLPSPAFVLLDKPAFENPEQALHRLQVNVWHGWLVSSDVDYMNEFDVLLADEGLREDACQFVQCWNRVDVYLPTVHRVAGTVGEPLLGSIRRVSHSFVSGKQDAEMSHLASPGQLVQRRVGDNWIMSGTRQDEMDSSDPRNEFVEICGQFGSAVSQSVWSMLRDAARQASVQPAQREATTGNSYGQDRNLLLQLVELVLGAPRPAGAAAATRKPHGSEPKRSFRLTWTQGDDEWTLEGWARDERREVLLSSASVRQAPSWLRWADPDSSVVAQFAVKQEGDRRVVEMSLLEARRRVELIQDDKASGELAQRLPVVVD